MIGLRARPAALDLDQSSHSLAGLMATGGARSLGAGGVVPTAPMKASARGDFYRFFVEIVELDSRDVLSIRTVS
jgi:hypothetical protein